MQETTKYPDEDFDKLKHPVLLSIGDRDATTSIEETTEVFRKIKNAQLLVLPNTFQPFEKINPEISGNELKRFLLS